MAENLASPAGLEPATPGLGNRCSIRLSYGDFQCVRCLRYVAVARYWLVRLETEITRSASGSLAPLLPHPLRGKARYIGLRSGQRLQLRLGGELCERFADWPQLGRQRVALLGEFSLGVIEKAAGLVGG